MKQKLLLLATILCSAFSVQAVNWHSDQITSGNEYYLYNPNAKVFLNANGSVGTSPDNLWTITVTGNSCEIKSSNCYISIELEKNLFNTGLSTQNAYSGQVPNGADKNLKYIQKQNGYQFYYTQSWKPLLTTYYATGFLTASTSGIGCHGIWHGSSNPGTPSYNGNEALWYLISPEQYNDAVEYYYYQVKTSANLGAQTYLSTTSDATNGESIVSDTKSPTKPNNKVKMYAFVQRPNDFSQFLGWKTSEDATDYVSHDNPCQIEVEYFKGIPENGPTLTLYAEFTQIYTDSPEPGDYVLFNPEHGFYMQSTINGNTVTSDPNLATLYYVDNYDGGGLDFNEYTTLQFDNKTYYVNQEEGNSSNSTERCGWIVQKRDDGYTLFEYENVGTTQRYISAYDEVTNGSGIAFRKWKDVDLPLELNNNRWPESTWMFFSKEHWQSVSANNSAVLAVNATVRFGTFVAPFDITLPEGVKAHKVTGFENDGYTLILTEAANQNETLPANTAVVLESINGTDIVETVVAQGEAYGERNANSGPYLVGTYEKKEVPVGSYLLQRQNNHTAFFKVDGTKGTLYSGKNRAYLTVPQESGEGVKAFSLNGSETAIDEVIILNEDTAIYDLSGRRLSKKPTRGIYIQNGKKILVK